MIVILVGKGERVGKACVADRVRARNFFLGFVKSTVWLGAPGAWLGTSSMPTRRPASRASLPGVSFSAATRWPAPARTTRPNGRRRPRCSTSPCRERPLEPPHVMLPCVLVVSTLRLTPNPNAARAPGTPGRTSAGVAGQQSTRLRQTSLRAASRRPTMTVAGPARRAPFRAMTGAAGAAARAKKGAPEATAFVKRMAAL